MADEFQGRTPRLILFELWAVVALFVVPTIGPAVDWNALYRDPDLQAWQTGIGAIVGLIGLGLIALLNAELNRRRDDRLRRDEARALAEALAAELESLKNTANRHIEELESLSDEASSAYEQPRVNLLEIMRLAQPIVFEGSATKLGLLGPNLAAVVVQTYASFELVNKNIERQLRLYADLKFTRRWIEVFGREVKVATEWADETISGLHSFASSQ